MAEIAIKPSEEGRIVVVQENPTEEQLADLRAVQEHNKNWKRGPVRMWKNRPRRYLARELPDGRYRDLNTQEIIDLDLENCSIEV